MNIHLLRAGLISLAIAQTSVGSVVFTNLHSFNISANGANPQSEMVARTDGNLYGTTQDGGTNGGFGTFFKLTPAGSLTTLYHFPGGSAGGNPLGKLAVGGDGNFYGIDAGGGQFGSGAAFRMTLAGSYSTIHSFGADTNSPAGPLDGAQPQAGLVLGTNGAFYGVTTSGGQYGNGTVFAMTSSGDLSVLYSFGKVTDSSGNPLDGTSPNSELSLAPDGTFYGVTPSGGAFGLGTVFQVTSDGTLTTLYSFGGLTNSIGIALDGEQPSGRLLLGTNGSFYGVTAFGGNNDDGSVFQITTNGVLTTVYSFGSNLDQFGNPLDGLSPNGGLIMGPDGNLYGVTEQGGTSDFGTVYLLTPDGTTLTTLHAFTGARDGSTPVAAVSFLNGWYYGLASSGGNIVGNGAIFKVSGAGAFTTLFVFPATPDGGNPSANVSLGADGNFYGTTEDGGNFGAGTMFKVTTNGSFSVILQFDGSNGAAPEGDLLLDTSGIFYGTSSGGGANGFGNIFEVTERGVLTSIYDFGSLSGPTGALLDGTTPWSGVVFGPDGNLYGTTSSDGLFGAGTVFQATPGGSLSTLVAFAGNNGASPMAALVLGTDGNFYGTTSAGGANQSGTVFQVTPAGSLTTLYSFQGANDGSDPEGALVEGAPGVFYGTTASGGTEFAGTIFRLDPDGTLTTLYSFSGPDGDGPMTGLTMGPDGSFYGTTVNGGAAGNGVVFQLTSNGVYSVLHSFQGAGDGANPDSGLKLGPDGNLYGVAEYGGIGGFGTLFRVSFVPDEAPTLSSVSVGQGTFNFYGSATSGVLYQIQYKTQLSDPTWLNLGPPLLATNSSISVSDLVGANQQRFYRVKSPP